MWFLHYRYLMGGRRGPDVPSVGFKPNPVIVRSDSQSGDAIQELIKGGELHWIHLFGKFRIDAKVMIDDPRGHRRRYRRWGGHDKAAESERLAYSPSSLRGNVILDVRRAIEPCGNFTEELSMKAPMSVSKPADLG